MSKKSLLTGYYGKIPSRGDFVSHNIPPSFIEPWDDWLQHSLDCSRKQLGHEWLDAYLTCPIYRFVLSTGICGNSVYLGIMMPSVDQVGRYFPMIFCAPIAEPINPLDIPEQYNAWFDAIEELALRTLREGFEPEQLNSALEQQNNSAPLFDSAPHQTQNYTNNNSLAIQQALAPNSALSNHYPALLNSVLKETCFAYSLWWTKGSEAITSSILLSQGLPPAESFVAFYDGQWAKWGWLNNASTATPIKPGMAWQSTTANAEPWGL